MAAWACIDASLGMCFTKHSFFLLCLLSNLISAAGTLNLLKPIVGGGERLFLRLWWFPCQFRLGEGGLLLLFLTDTAGGWQTEKSVFEGGKGGQIPKASQPTPAHAISCSIWLKTSVNVDTHSGL